VQTLEQLLPPTEGGYYGTMSCAIEAKDAIYFFVTEEEGGMVQVTKYIRKGCKGYDQGTKVSKQFARTWYKQLCNA
jgi:hypothetical protein